MQISTIDEAYALIDNKVPIRYSGMSFIAEEYRVRKGIKGQRVSSLALVQSRERADGLGHYKTIIWAPVEKCEVVRNESVNCFTRR